jgi:hypothetical protein
LSISRRTLEQSKKAGQFNPAFRYPTIRQQLRSVVDLLRGTIDQFHVRHQRIVARTIPAFHDAQVASRTILIPRSQGLKQFTHGRFVAQARKRQSAVGDGFASVIRGSATRRNSFALGSVVLMISCSISDADMFLNIDFRCALVRPSERPDLRCRIVFSPA